MIILTLEILDLNYRVSLEVMSCVNRVTFGIILVDGQLNEMDHSHNSKMDLIGLDS